MTDKLRHLWLMVAAILALASCSQDDVGEGGSPTDDTPVIFSATGITPIGGATRATVDGTWEGTAAIFVKVGNANERSYIVKPSSDKKSATLEAAPGITPFKWSEVEGKKVKAFNIAEDAHDVKTDQSDFINYQASDLIIAEATGLTKDNNTLEFKHKVARLVITVSNGDIESDKVELVVGSQTIKPYCDKENSRYLALVKSGMKSISVKISHGGKDYIYTHTTSERLMDGDSYTINVKIFNPMHITDEATLKAWAAAVKGDPTVSAIVDNDFSMSTPADGGSNWEPVSTFKGTFDGNGKTITGLVVNDKSGYNVGFINNNHGTVKNLTLKDAKITSFSSVGAVAYYNYGTIENCHVTGASWLRSNDSASGVVAGYNYGTIIACHVAKECKIKGHVVGGIVGYNKEAKIIGCYALCSLEGACIGGICGELRDGSLTACYSKCSYIRADYYYGGIAGEVYNSSSSKFSDCYWQGDTNCTQGVGNTATDPDGVIKVAGNVIWDGIYGYMNDALEGTGYKYKISDDEPLVLVKK